MVLWGVDGLGIKVEAPNQPGNNPVASDKVNHYEWDLTLSRFMFNLKSHDLFSLLFMIFYDI